MRSGFKRASYFLSSLLLLAGVILWLTLPNVSFSSSANSTGTTLGVRNSERHAALEKLHAQMMAGAQFAEEERDILRRLNRADT